MARRLPLAPRLRRGAASREAKPQIVLVCEGKVTEPEYFRELRRITANSLVDVTTIDAKGVPISVVEEAIKQRARLQSSARRSRDSYDKLFEVWAVFDVDEHPRVPEAETLARMHEIRLAVSNPCFEVWGIAHFYVPSKPMRRDEAQRELNRLLPSYHHERSPKISAIDLEERREIAVDNANRCLEDRYAERCSRGNPSTEVGLLIKQIFLWARGQR